MNKIMPQVACDFGSSDYALNIKKYVREVELRKSEQGAVSFRVRGQ